MKCIVMETRIRQGAGIIKIPTSPDMKKPHECKTGMQEYQSGEL